jgi:hypothetical protein
MTIRALRSSRPPGVFLPRVVADCESSVETGCVIGGDCAVCLDDATLGLEGDRGDNEASPGGEFGCSCGDGTVFLLGSTAT